MEVDGRVALVTGANLGIGAATLKSYVEPMLTRSLCSPCAYLTYAPGRGR